MITIIIGSIASYCTCDLRCQMMGNISDHSYPSNSSQIKEIEKLIKEYKLNEAEYQIRKVMQQIDKDSGAFLHLQLLKVRLLNVEREAK